MEIWPTDLPEVLVVKPRQFGDGRGFFFESWSRRAFEAQGLDLDFVQDNHSYSAQRGTIRGLHFQAPPFAQAKLVRVASGRILDVAVDIRKGSPTFGASVSVELNAENGLQLLVPEGFLHGFATLEDDCHVLYKTNGFYDRASEGAVHWADPDLAIDWGVPAADAVLSEKDAAAEPFAALETPFLYSAG